MKDIKLTDPVYKEPQGWVEGEKEQPKEDTKTSEIWNTPSPEYLEAVEQPAEWEDRFDKEITPKYNEWYSKQLNTDIKQFIQQVAKDKYKRGYNNGYKQYNDRT